MKKWGREGGPLGGKINFRRQEEKSSRVMGLHITISKLGDGPYTTEKTS